MLIEDFFFNNFIIKNFILKVNTNKHCELKNGSKKSFLKILNSYLIGSNLGCFFNKFIKPSKKDHIIKIQRFI